MPKFFLVAIVGLVLNTAIMALLTEIFRLHYLLSQILATAACLFGTSPRTGIGL